MSATNRNGLQRHEGDFYETPAYAIDAILDVLGIGPEYDGYVIDPGAGTGAIAHRVAERAPKADIRAVELNPELLARATQRTAATVGWTASDWLTWDSDGPADLVIGNPPYGPKGDRNLAEKFIRKALQVAGKKGTVAMLLRSSYMTPKSRRALRKEFGMPDKYELEKRPSFNGSGTDACDYAWHVWSPKRGGKWSVLENRGAPENQGPENRGAPEDHEGKTR